jgi:capsid protein
MSGNFQIDCLTSGMQESGRGSFTYDALEPKGRRKAPPTKIVREDIEVKGGKRKRLQANARDIGKNFSVAGWAVRRHLDYVASFRFDCQTGDRVLDKEVEALIEDCSEPDNCDRGGRLSREKMFRLLELSRVLDGDMGMVRLDDGRCQLIESDLIADPDKKSSQAKSQWEWVDGVEVDYAGLPRQYSIHKRTQTGTQWSRNVTAANLHLYGFFDRSASDQVRGISPIVTALNPWRDAYEGLDYTLVKFKIAQLFAMALTRKTEAIGLNQALPTGTEQAIIDGDEDEADVTTPREFDLTGGPTVLDLDEDEDIKVVESGVPPAALDTFWDLVIAVGLKSLDIPYSFYNERFTNYSGSRTAWLHYDRSAIDKRADQIQARKKWTYWQLQTAIASGKWSLPSKMTLKDLRFAWHPRGMPWWKPSEEIVGDLKAIAGGLSNVQLVCQQRDTDFFENIDRNLEALLYVKDRAAEVLGPEHQFALNWQAVFAGSTPDAEAR